METANTILLYEECGQIKQRFCPESEARNFLDKAKVEMRGGSMFAVDGGLEAEFVLKVCPQLREKVNAAKTKLKADTRLRDALTKHGVPLDQDIRIAIYNAFEDLKIAA